MQFTTQNVLRLAQAQGGFKRGDIWILNDPYVGGTHLQDAQLVFVVLLALGHERELADFRGTGNPGAGREHVRGGLGIFRAARRGA